MTIGAAQSAAVGTYPHGALLVGQQVDNVGTHQSVFQSFRHLQLLDGNLLVANLHDQDAVGRARPHLAVLGQCNGAHLEVGTVRIASHDVLVVEGDVASVLVFAHHVDTTAVRRYPDVALLVLYSLVGSIAAQRVGVVVVVADVDDVVAAGSGRYLKESLVLVANPVVALAVHRNAVRTADGIAL